MDWSRQADRCPYGWAATEFYGGVTFTSSDGYRIAEGEDWTDTEEVWYVYPPGSDEFIESDWPALGEALWAVDRDRRLAGRA